MRRALLLLSVAAFAVGLSPLTAQETPHERPAAEVNNDLFYGRSALLLPKPTSAGSWHGTWIYVNRDVRFALWLSENDGAPIAKLRYLGVYLTPETFETDWTGSARYFVRDKPVSFDLKLTKTSPDQIEATWDWDLDLQGSGRTEHANLDIYRSGDGRRMVLYFKDFERVLTSNGKTKRFEKAQAWTFTKISKRLVLWEELPL